VTLSRCSTLRGVARSGLANEDLTVRSEVFTAMTIKNGVLRDVTSYATCKNWRFGGT
jgi:hypothetical protein